MKRRNFLQLLAATGMSAHLPVFSSSAHGATAPQKYLVVVNAGGGWDPTSICDPKGLNQAYVNNSDRHLGSTNSVELDSNKQFGQIQWSAIPEFVSNDEAVRLRIENQFDQFFQTYGDRLTVINGIDNGTNNHDTGNRVTWSGHEEIGYPSISALYAAAVSPTLPMAFISNGGYDYTDSLVARARASSAGFINEIADSNYWYTDSNDQFKTGLHYRDRSGNVDIYNMIKQAQSQRIQRQQASEALPQKRAQLSQLFGIRSTDSNLGALSVHLADIQNNVSRDSNWNTNRSNSLKSQAEVVAAAFKSNLAASANLNIGGFDTHGDHDARAYPQLGDLLEGVHFLNQALSYAGIADKTTVVIGSDFGRTPYYNSGNGKDHWPITSVMVMHPAGTSTGGRVFGASTIDFRAQAINRQTGLPDSNGDVLGPHHVNNALRQLMGINSSAVAGNYPLNFNAFNIFS